MVQLPSGAAVCDCALAAIASTTAKAAAPVDNETLRVMPISPFNPAIASLSRQVKREHLVRSAVAAISLRSACEIGNGADGRPRDAVARQRQRRKLLPAVCLYVVPFVLGKARDIGLAAHHQ